MILEFPKVLPKISATYHQFSLKVVSFVPSSVLHHWLYFNRPSTVPQLGARTQDEIPPPPGHTVE
jgi:hypothetical protein